MKRPKLASEPASQACNSGEFLVYKPEALCQSIGATLGSHLSVTVCLLLH